MRAIDPLRPLDRGGVGQLDVEEQIALVLLRDEAGRRAMEDPDGQDEQAAVDDQHDHAEPQHPADRPAVERRSPGRTAG